jgi:magnesium transporter
MVKKTKRKPFPGNSYMSTESSNPMNSTSSVSEIQPEMETSFIDHRNQHDLANISASASRVRRRYSQIPHSGDRRATELPLTNKNLLQLYNHSKSVALDMDAFTSEQSKLTDLNEFAQEQGWNNPFDTLSGGDRSGDNFSVESLGFGESNPSSEHSDSSSSLDDVFAPDKEETFGWPDLRVMQEFIYEECHDLHTVHSPERQRSPFDNRHQNNSLPEHSSYQSPKQRKSFDSFSELEDAPLLNNIQVNEVDSLEASHDALRVRPLPIQPWQPMPSILKNKLDPLPRFTYFREDLDKTIHSSSISGLISNEDGENTLEKLQELFSPSYYSKTLNKCTSAASLANKSVSSQEPQTNDPELKLPTDPISGAPSNSLNASVLSDSRNTPFWLDVLDPTEEEMKVISKTFGIHPLTTEDIFLGEAREKVEVFKSYYFVCFTSFDIVHERRKQQEKEKEKMIHKLQELIDQQNAKPWWNLSRWTNRDEPKPSLTKDTPSIKSTIKKTRSGELVPLNMYMIIFKDAVITFHFSQTPHPINVRRRARLLRDHITVTSDWISYALIDDITDSFAPMIEAIEDEVNSIEDAILRMQSLNSDDDSDSDDDDTPVPSLKGFKIKERKSSNDVFFKRPRSKSTVDINPGAISSGVRISARSGKSTSTRSSSTRSTDSKVLRWRRQGDMLRRIGECRKRVMSILRLLGTKADVVRAFSKRFSESSIQKNNDRSEIGMYLGDIQDHIVTMFQSLNHYEKLLARFHANYLAQINIDMTKVNNDTNDVLGKLTVMGTIVLPLNVITGLWGMNCIVPGQDYDGLAWFFGIIGFMTIFSWLAFNYAKRVTNL